MKQSESLVAFFMSLPTDVLAILIERDERSVKKEMAEAAAERFRSSLSLFSWLNKLTKQSLDVKVNQSCTFVFFSEHESKRVTLSVTPTSSDLWVAFTHEDFTDVEVYLELSFRNFELISKTRQKLPV